MIVSLTWSRIYGRSFIKGAHVYQLTRRLNYSNMLLKIGTNLDKEINILKKHLEESNLQ